MACTLKLKHPPSSRVSPTAVPPLHTLREPTASATRGAILGTRIDRDISLIMPPSFVCQLRTQTTQSDGTNRQARRSLRSSPCDSNSVYELAHTVYKYASNECPLEVRSASSRTAVFISSSKLHIPCTSSLRISVRFGCGAKPHPQLLIINYSLLIVRNTLLKRQFRKIVYLMFLNHSASQPPRRCS